MRKIITSIFVFLLLISFASAIRSDCSQDPNDYFTLDDGGETITINGTTEGLPFAHGTLMSAGGWIDATASRYSTISTAVANGTRGINNSGQEIYYIWSLPAANNATCAVYFYDPGDRTGTTYDMQMAIWSGVWTDPYDGFGIREGSSESYYAGYTGGSVVGTVARSVGWHELKKTFETNGSSGLKTIYIDGVQAYQLTSGPSVMNYVKLRTVAADGWLGYFDELMCWNRSIYGDDCPPASEEDTTPPTFSNIANNVSKAFHTGDKVNFSATITDVIDLTGGTAIFSWNDTGSWVNTTVELNNLTGTTQNVNIIKTISAVEYNYICGKWYANDTAGNMGGSAVSCFWVDELPKHRYVGTNDGDNTINTNDTINLTAEIYDYAGLSYAWLWTNESGGDGRNYTITRNSTPTSLSVVSNVATYVTGCYGHPSMAMLNSSDILVSYNLGTSGSISSFWYYPNTNTYSSSYTVTGNTPRWHPDLKKVGNEYLIVSEGATDNITKWYNSTNGQVWTENNLAITTWGSSISGTYTTAFTQIYDRDETDDIAWVLYPNRTDMCYLVYNSTSHTMSGESCLFSFTDTEIGWQALSTFGFYADGNDYIYFYNRTNPSADAGKPSIVVYTNKTGSWQGTLILTNSSTNPMNQVYPTVIYDNDEYLLFYSNWTDTPDWTAVWIDSLVSSGGVDFTHLSVITEETTVGLAAPYTLKLSNNNYLLAYKNASTTKIHIIEINNDFVNGSPRGWFPQNGLADTWVNVTWQWQNTSIQNGTIAWRIYYNDTSGQINSTPIQTFSISSASSDTTPPSFSSQFNSTDTKRYTNITINITATDTNLDNISLWHNESGTWIQAYNVTSIGTSSYNLSYNFNVTNRVYNEEFSWNVTACDNQSNCNNSNTYIVTINNTIPVIYANISTFNYSVGHKVKFNASAYDPDGDKLTPSITNFNCSTSSLHKWSQTGLLTYYEVNCTGTAYQKTEVRIALQDNAGTSAYAPSSSTYLINTYPNNPPTIPSVNITSSDNLNRTNGTLTGIWASSDLDGDNFTLNQTKWYKDSTEQTALENQTSIGSGNTTKGEAWVFSVRSYDGADWSNYSNSTSMAIANIAPSQPAIIYPANNSYYALNSISLNVSAADNDDDAITYYHFINGTLNSTTTNANSTFNATDGSYSYYVIAGDGTGNSTASLTIYFTLDTTLPSISYSTATSNASTFYSQNWIYVNVSVAEANFKNITFYLYNLTNLVNETAYTTQTYSINLTSLQNGNYSINATIYDTAGYSASAPTRNSIVLDTIYPAIGYSGGTLTNATWHSQNWVFVNVSASDVNLGSVVFEWNGANETFNSNYYENKTSLADGNYTLRAYVNDSAGNKNETMLRIAYLDDTLPSVDFAGGTETDNAHFNREWIYINATFTELNFNNITFNLYNTTGSVNSTDYTAATYSINWTAANLNEIYKYNITVKDKAGNIKSTATRTITLDNTSPIINSLLPANDTSQESADITAKFNATDTNPSKAELWANFSGIWAKNQTLASWTSNSLASFIGVELTDGHYIWNVRCNDSAGNSAWFSDNYTITIADTTAPNVTLITANYTNFTTQSITLSYNVTDTNRITNCSIYLNNTLNSTDTTITRNISQYFTITLPNADYLWKVGCYDSKGNNGNSTEYILNVAYTAPESPSGGETTGYGSGSGLLTTSCDNYAVMHNKCYHLVAGRCIEGCLEGETCFNAKCVTQNITTMANQPIAYFNSRWQDIKLLLKELFLDNLVNLFKPTALNIEGGDTIDIAAINTENSGISSKITAKIQDTHNKYPWLAYALFGLIILIIIGIQTGYMAVIGSYVAGFALSIGYLPFLILLLIIIIVSALKLTGIL